MIKTVKKGVIISLILTLFGCSHPTEQGQQYQDGQFDDDLNQVELVKTNTPLNSGFFSEQVKQVLDKSPSMSERYQNLYQLLEMWKKESGDPATLSQYGIEIAQMGGADRYGNVLYTGYFSPVIEIRAKADEQYRYPLYGNPNCGDTCPTREEIYDGALDNQGLILGYSDSLIDNFMMEVQGSGFVHYGDTDKLEYFAYNGKNNKAYVSIGRILIERDEVAKEDMSLKAIKDWVKLQDEETVFELLEQNPSFVFFAAKDASPVVGTAGIPLVAGASVAGDRSLLPMGTPILAEVPQIDLQGKWNGKYELKLMLVLDTGGAVKKGHFDLYYGIGEQAGVEAGHNKYFGRAWKLGLSGSDTEQPWLVN
ncbi:murein transglycosylase A [Vibrio sp. SS-MA-C1-2]|uniref:murein transglycosylase A n=1 Tax=Vibrio sp. SS-MA-C1-2 TaxID=2908646 RepID=UPI001F16C0E5|nr:murein transglycosylase A [Vibrio sp. SS-MA-C1-2]UJF18922.1 murein transglycosylase A [Vibrio sp. SS-MA-C1-2]